MSTAGLTASWPGSSRLLRAAGRCRLTRPGTAQEANETPGDQLTDRDNVARHPSLLAFGREALTATAAPGERPPWPAAARQSRPRCPYQPRRGAKGARRRILGAGFGSPFWRRT